MTRRALMVPLVATLLVLAGCLAAPVAPTGDGTPDERTANGTPPGVADGQLANASALARAHETSLARSGFAANVSYSTAGTEVAGYHVVAAAGRSTYALSGTRSAGENGTVQMRLWANESHRVAKYGTGDEARYRTTLRETDALDLVDPVGEYLRAGAFTVANETTAEGYTVLTADDVDPAGDDHGRLDDATSFSGRAVVDEAGRVHELTATVERDRGSETYTFDLRRTDVASVDRPGWLDDAPADATVAPRLAVDVRDGTVLVVKNEAGDAVPANTTLALTTNGTTYRATFDAPLEPGETRYAAVAADDGAFRLAAEEPAESDTVALTSPVSVRIETDSGVTLYSAGMGWGSSSASSGEASGGSSTSGSGSESTR